MHVAVGSENPVKRRAVERVFPDATVAAVAVDSGVSEQPVGDDETARGAVRRARRAREARESDLGVGIEGGVAELSLGAPGGRGDGDDPLFLVMWAAVTDGDRLGRGTGPSIRLPDAIADRVRAGEELGPVMDDVLDASNVAKKGGAAGAFTRGRLSRADALEDAVVAAYAPVESALY